MVATLHILVLVCSLVVCPLRCMGLDCAAEATETGASCCRCEHCQRTSTEPTDHDDEPRPAKDCSCGSCLCHGAVLSDDEVIVQPLDSFTAVATVVIPEVHVNLTALVQQPSESRPPSSGKVLCISKQALLL